MSGPMNSHSITDYILKLEKENSDLKKFFKEANEEKINALNELNDLKYKNRSFTETTARVLFRCVNHGLVDRLIELSEMTSDIHKTMTYQKAADAVANLSYEVESGESLLQIPGIGKGIAAKINEYLDEQDSDYEESVTSTEEAFFVSGDMNNFSEDEDEESESVASNEGQNVEESDDEEFFASFNADLTDMLHTLADETDDKFKCRAYRRAANSVYELPYKIVSGKMISQGLNKVPGVGKSIGKKIDEFLATGNIKKYESVSTNDEIAIALTYLADDTDDHFKARAFMNAAKSIRDLDFEVTNGEELSTGPNKVKGIGKKIAKKIDQFIQTGNIA